MRVALALVLLAACGDNITLPSDTLAVGYDAYRRLDQLPRIHLGDRVYMRATNDRAGGNEGADAAHFIRAEADGTYTALDVAGPGMLVFTRANRWHGSPWHHVIDRVDHAITESSTATPEMPVLDPVFMPERALPAPLAVTWPDSRGADLDWVPQPFAHSLRISDERTHYATGYYIFHVFGDTEQLSAPIAPWAEQPPPSDVLELFARAGTDIAPAGTDHAATVAIPAQGDVEVMRLAGPAVIRRLVIDAPASDALALADARVAITWDDRALPSVDAPIGLLFAGGSLYRRSSDEYLVRGLLANVRFVDGSSGPRIQLALYFPMPFHDSARVMLVGAGQPLADVHVAIRTNERYDPAGADGYFHASYVDHQTPLLGYDLVLLDTTTVEGGGEWCGLFAGTSFTFSDAAVLETLEGDPRFFFDDARSPQGHGTGTEEWAGGGDYFGGATSSLPLAGHPTGAPSPAGVQAPADAIESAYRFLIADAMPFGRNARIQLEHGGTDQSLEHYRSVTYWYGRPSACLRLTDTLDVGDVTAEVAHRYSSPASTPITETSHWDGLTDGADNPLETEDGRVTSAASTFIVTLDPANQGVLLRRTLDYSIPDQRAEVWIADADDGAVPTLAGIWYTAGSTTVVYSNPPGELDPPQPQLQTVDRRLKDDEFVVPRLLTEGRSAIRIQLRPSGMWSELRYAVYSYVR